MSISSCPICGATAGVTHGDQIWTSEICEACEPLREWYYAERRRKMLEALAR